MHPIQKKAGVAILTSVKIDFKAKSIISEQKHCPILKTIQFTRKICQFKNLNYTYNIALEYIKQNRKL